MYLVTQNGKNLVNMDVYDTIRVEDSGIIASKDNRTILLGMYGSEEAAMKEFNSLVSNLGSVIVMD